jgi:hypothetical protein
MMTIKANTLSPLAQFYNYFYDQYAGLKPFDAFDREASQLFRSRTMTSASAGDGTGLITVQTGQNTSNFAESDLRVSEDNATVLHIPTRETSNDPYRDPKQIPHISPPVFVYQRSEAAIDQLYRDRFLQVINIFRHNIECDEALKTSIKFVDYCLRMCGPSQNQCHPSILVFCRKKDFELLKKALFGSKNLASQYLRRATKPKTLKFRRPTTEGASEDPNKPLFNIYFWREARPRTLLWSDEAEVTVDFGSSSESQGTNSNFPFTLCGAPVYKFQRKPRTSTIGCLIQVGSGIYSLTARHEFTYSGSSPTPVGTDIWPAANTGGQSMAANNVLECQNEDSSVEQYCDSFVYEDTDSDESGENSDKEIEEEQPAELVGPNIQTNTAIFPSAKSQQKLDMDLDWALIRLDDRVRCFLNAYTVNTSDQSTVTCISSAASTFPQIETDVFIITAQKVVRKGKFLPSESVL